MDTTHSGGHHKILQMSVCPSGAAYVERGRGGAKIKRKKKEQCAPKAGAKATPNSTTPRVGGACPFSASSISSLHLRDRGTPAYRGYKQTAAGHTDKVTNAGHLHLAARVQPYREAPPLLIPYPRHQPPPRSFRRCFSFFRSPIQSAFSSSLMLPHMDRLYPVTRAHVYVTYIMYSSRAQPTVSFAFRASRHMQIFRF